MLRGTALPAHEQAGVLECAVCGEEPTDPTTAPCQHNFCIECLGAWVRARRAAGGEPARCPLCRALVDQDPERLAVNTGLRDVLAALAALRSAGGAGADGAGEDVRALAARLKARSNAPVAPAPPAAGPRHQRLPTIRRLRRPYWYSRPAGP
jgi:hypothetical protein